MAPVCTGAGFGATPLHGFPWLSHTGPSAQGPSRARPDFAGGFLGIVKGRGTAGGACSTQQRTCTQTPERKAASPPEGMLDVRAFHRRHSLRYTCHSRLHLISLQSKGLSRVFSNTTVQKHPFFWRSAFFIVQLSHPYMTTGKTIALTGWTFVGKVMSLLFNMLSTLVITFLPRSKHLLIS